MAIVLSARQPAYESVALELDRRLTSALVYDLSDDSRSPAQTFRQIGDSDAALAAAETVVEAEYEVPFQGHTAIGPAHGMADPSDGQMTIYSNDMKSYGLRDGVAEFLSIPRDRVRRKLKVNNRILWGPTYPPRTCPGARLVAGQENEHRLELVEGIWAIEAI